MTVVFVLSCARSGSTWLGLVLGSCSQAYSLGEYHRPWILPGDGYCRLCEADGLACTVLYGIEEVPRRDAFHFAAARTGRQIIVDSSKSIAWCTEFLGRADLDVRLVHLVRHPCGFVESEHRRRAPALSLDELLAEWETVNRQIAEFTTNAGAPATLVCYDDLADAPEQHFPPLCRFIGMLWEEAALAYWNFPHHGLGGNGAASLYLRGRKISRFNTGDDAFYADMKDRPIAADRRFRERLPEEFRRRAVEHPYARSLREQLGKEPWQP
jgi:hypothetical protein